MSDQSEDEAVRPEPPFRWEALLASAQQFAHACLTNYSVQDAAFFYLHAGASVELAIKAALCRASPVLLVEGGSRLKDDSLIRLAGYEPVVTERSSAGAQPQRQIFTVGFEAAMRRFQLLYGPESLGVTHLAMEELKAARDVTAHGGAVSEVSAETLLRVLVTLCKVHEALAPRFDHSLSQFWGDLFSLVERSMREDEDARRQQIDALVGAAQRRFQQEYGDLDDETLSAVIMQASDRVQLKHDHDRRTCPVCGAQGISRVRALKQMVVQRRRPKTQRGWTAVDFRCFVCKLWLPTEELVRLTPGMEPWESADDEWDLEFWFEDIAELDAEDRDFFGVEDDDLPDTDLRDDED